MTVPKVSEGLGYCDLRQFNLALLAKQGYRLLKYPNSLAAKILKACYFAHSDFMTIAIGANPSQIWRSICASRFILQKGCQKCVGDGSSINIWKDLWLLNN